MLDATDLPDDADALRASVVGHREEVARLTAANIHAHAEIARLTAIIAAFQRHRFGARSEKLDAEQMELALEALDQAVARVEAGIDAAQANRIVQAPAPARIVEGGIPTEALIAHVLVSKYADHLPLYRQAQIYARQGVELDRSTLCDWVGRAAWWLTPLRDHLLAALRRSGKLFADETTAPVQGPGRGRTKTGQLWAYARDDRPWGGTDPPAVACVYAPDRKAERPIAHLAGFKGVLQVDGYGGYAALARRGNVRLAFCWAHVRRRFCELVAAGASPVASEALAQIARLYAVEADVRGRSPDDRRAEREAKSRPIVDMLRAFLEAKSAQASRKSALAEAIRYALTRWDGLCRFLGDGHVEIDSNVVERAIRPIGSIAKTRSSPAPTTAAITGRLSPA